MAVDSPAPNPDPAEAERLLVAQLVSRRALAGRIVHRLAPWSNAPSLPIRMFPTVLGAPFRGLTDGRLQTATYGRREAQHQAQVDRFWWRRAAPHMALLARRRARLLAIPARAEVRRREVSPVPSPEVPTARPAIAPEQAAGAPILAAGQTVEAWSTVPAEGWTAAAEEATLPPGERPAIDRIPSGDGEASTGVAPGLGVAPGSPAPGPLAGLRRTASTAWQRLATVLAPNRAPTRGGESAERDRPAEVIAGTTVSLTTIEASNAVEAGPVPPEGLGHESADVAASAVDEEDLSSLSIEEIQDLQGAERAAREAIQPADAAPISGGPAAALMAAESEDFSELGMDVGGSPWVGEPASPAESVAPLAAEIARRLTATSGALAASSTPGPSPTRLFWWPVAQAAAPQRGTLRAQTEIGAHREPAGIAQVPPSAGLDLRTADPDPGRATSTAQQAEVTFAPGLLGILRRAQQAAASPPERSLELSKAIRRADTWAHENAADHERWRVHPTPALAGGPTGEPADSPIDLVYGPSSTPVAPVAAAGASDGPSVTFASAPLPEGPSIPLAPGAVLEAPPGNSATAGPPSHPMAMGGQALAGPSAGHSAEPPASHGPVNLIGAPLALVGALVGALTGRRDQPLHPTTRGYEGLPEPALPTGIEATIPPRTTALPAGVADVADTPASPEASATRSGAPPESPAPPHFPSAPDTEPPAPVVRAEPASRRGQEERATTALFHALARRLTRATRDQAQMGLYDAGPAGRPGASVPSPGTPRSEAAPGGADVPREAAPGPAGSSNLLPERPWESGDAELAAVISHLPAPMAAAAIAAGVLGETSLPPSLAAGASPGSQAGWQPLGSLAHAPAAPWGQGSRAGHEAASQPTAAEQPIAASPVPSAWSAVETAHPVGPAWGAAASAAQAAAAGMAAPTPPSPAVGRAAAASGIARAPIDRPVAGTAAEAPASDISAGSAAAGAPATPGPATGGTAPDLDQLTEEVFDRLRWRLGAERERYVL